MALMVMTGCSSNAPATPTPAAATVAPPTAPPAATPLKIGLLAICGGPFATFQQEAFLGAKYALIRLAGGTSAGQGPEDGILNAVIAGHPVQLYFGCSDATPDVAVAQARLLVEQQHVDVLLGPESGDEGVAIANYAKTQPGVTFVNGTSGAQITTLQIKAPNFFRFGGDGAQWMAGVGTYAYKTLGWRKAAILAEDYSYPYTLAAGFIGEFCSEGGQVTQRIYVPFGINDWSPYIAQLPTDVDGTLLLTGGTNTTNALAAYTQIGGDPATKMLGGSSVMDPTSFVTGDPLVGMAGGSPVPQGSTDQPYAGWVHDILNVYPSVPAESLFTLVYYNSMQAIIEGMTQVNGDLSNSHAAFNDALAHLQPQFPQGKITLDANRNATIPAFVTQFTKDANGVMGLKVLKSIANVDETFGGLFNENSPAPSRDAPECKAGTPPPWAANW
jgi:branched-chain amino acid transport system substrate-binding protein